MISSLNIFFLISFQDESKEDLQNNLAKNSEGNVTFKNGLTAEMQNHLPGYNPYEKSYTNTGIEAESEF